MDFVFKLIKFKFNLLMFAVLFNFTNRSYSQIYPKREGDFRFEFASSQKRDLTLNIYSVVSTVSGISNATSIYTFTISVQARSYYGNLISTGGSYFYAIINNQCVAQDNFDCTEISGASQVVSSTLEGWMTDNGDGTYSYPVTISNSGVITIQVLYYDLGVIGVYYSNSLWTPPSNFSEITSILDNDWGTDEVIPDYSNNVSAYYLFMLKAPFTDTYNIFVDSNDDASLYIDSVLRFNSWTSTNQLQSTTISLTQNVFYKFKIKYREVSGSANVQLYWNYTGVAQQIIPYNYLYFPQNVGSTPVNLTLECPPSYFPKVSGYSTNCASSCFDGFRNYRETCDNNNANNGEGCITHCTVIQSGWVCSGGSTTSADICKECSVCYSPNTNQDKCNIIPIPDNIINLLTLFYFLMAVNIISNILSVNAKHTSIPTIFLHVISVQLIVLLSVLGAYWENIIDWKKLILKKIILK